MSCIIRFALVRRKCTDTTRNYDEFAKRNGFSMYVVAVACDRANNTLEGRASYDHSCVFLFSGYGYPRNVPGCAPLFMPKQHAYA